MLLTHNLAHEEEPRQAGRRFDVGYNTTGSSMKGAVVVRSDGSIQEIADPVSYDPFTYDDPSTLTEIWRRLRLQFSIGEAF